ncbi:hypothetical protein QYM18_12965 [Ectopseudomonas chengduensis]|nr:hypothetical protein [Pseudomonas chengduensis]WKC35391.1 hypothetical protein QYM18_12965 [Pseudomonas chengduensis]
MNVLALLHEQEVSLLDIIYGALEEKSIDLRVLTFKKPFENECSQREEILSSIKESNVVVYFASKENRQNICLDLALREAARLNIKVICITIEGEQPNIAFEQLGDFLIPSIEALPDAILGNIQEWQSADGSLRDDRPFKRYKCGAKE